MKNKELEELTNIRNLTMLLLFKLGATQEEVASALGVTQARVSQMFPTKQLKPARLECQTVS